MGRCFYRLADFIAGETVRGPVYRKLRPFFLGLILGDVVVCCTVVLLESVIGVRGAGF